MELSLRSRLVLTLTIFSMFFGAGNLIFPPFLAAASGDGFIPAFIGFCLTAIGLPITALVAVERADGLGRLTGHIHPSFSIIYTVAIYLAIGPCLAIPRTASTSYEMVGNAFGLAGTAPRAIYSLIFFAAASLTAMRPEKLTKTLGRITCPLLILLIAALAIGSAAKGYGDVPATASDAYASAPFERAAYRWCAEPSIYLRPQAAGSGVGQALYDALERILLAQGYQVLYAIVTAENARSVRFHEKMGYSVRGELPACGWKFGRWIGVIWLEKRLKIVQTPSNFPVPWTEVVQDAKNFSHILDSLSLP